MARPYYRVEIRMMGQQVRNAAAPATAPIESSTRPFVRQCTRLDDVWSLAGELQADFAAQYGGSFTRPSRIRNDLTVRTLKRVEYVAIGQWSRSQHVRVIVTRIQSRKPKHRRAYA